MGLISRSVQELDTLMNQPAMLFSGRVIGIRKQRRRSNRLPQSASAYWRPGRGVSFSHFPARTWKQASEMSESGQAKFYTSFRAGAKRRLADEVSKPALKPSNKSVITCQRLTFSYKEFKNRRPKRPRMLSPIGDTLTVWASGAS